MAPCGVRYAPRALFDKIVTYAHHNGEPGALFLDTINRFNPVPHLYTLEATNPCGEQALGPYENCCLGSVNLAEHVTDDDHIAWEKLRETTVVCTRFLDNVVDANKYVPAVPQLREAALRARRIGLGIMGLGDMMYRLGVRYGSAEGQELAAQVMEFIRYHCMATSIALAEERGPFSAIRGSIYDPEQLRWQPPQPLTPYTRATGAAQRSIGMRSSPGSSDTASATPRRRPSRPPAPSARWPAARATAASRCSPWPTPAR